MTREFVASLCELCVWGCSASTLRQGWGDLSPLSVTLCPDRTAVWEYPWRTHVNTLRRVDCVRCDRHGGAGCRCLCRVLTSMSSAETRRDSPVFSLTSWPPHFCSFLLSVPTSPAFLPSVLFFYFLCFSLAHFNPTLLLSSSSLLFFSGNALLIHWSHSEYTTTKLQCNTNFFCNSFSLLFFPNYAASKYNDGNSRHIF